MNVSRCVPVMVDRTITFCPSWSTSSIVTCRSGNVVVSSTSRRFAPARPGGWPGAAGMSTQCSLRTRSRSPGSFLLKASYHRVTCCLSVVLSSAWAGDHRSIQRKASTYGLMRPCRDAHMMKACASTRGAAVVIVISVAETYGPDTAHGCRPVPPHQPPRAPTPRVKTPYNRPRKPRLSAPVAWRGAAAPTYSWCRRRRHARLAFARRRPRWPSGPSRAGVPPRGPSR